MKFSKLHSEKSLVVLDFNNQIWRSFHATIKQNMVATLDYGKAEALDQSGRIPEFTLENLKRECFEDGINVGFIIGLAKILDNISKKHRNAELVVCEDRYPKRKKNLQKRFPNAFKDYPSDSITGYKENREKKDYPYNPIEISRMFVNCIKHTKIFQENEEADDVIASFVEKHKDRNITIYSTDRDLWQFRANYPKVDIMLDDNSTLNGEHLSKSFGREVTWDKILLYKVIRGDNSDNIKSIRYFPYSKTVECFIKCDGSVKDYVKKIKETYGKTSKEYHKLISNKDLLQLNYNLAKLSKNIYFTTQVFSNPDRDRWNILCDLFETPSLYNSHLINCF